MKFNVCTKGKKKSKAINKATWVLAKASLNNPILIVLTKTWLNDGILNPAWKIEGFTFHQADRAKSRKCWGVAFYFKIQITSTTRIQLRK